MFGGQPFHFVPLIFGFLLHLFPEHLLVPSLLPEALEGESQITDWNYVMVWNEVDDLER